MASVQMIPEDEGKMVNNYCVIQKILFYGAGVLGSLYAARLHEAGYDISILARGQRLVELRQGGIILRDAITGRESITHVHVVEQLAPEDVYDLVVVPIRREQLSRILPVLAANRRVPCYLFMICNVNGPGEMSSLLGDERVLLGYAGAGGIRAGSIVQYTIVPSFLQKTMLGEPDGQHTNRINAIAMAFKQAGFSVAITPHIDAWLKTHVAWIGPLVRALSLYEGDNYRLANQPPAVRLMVSEICQNFNALEALGIPIEGPLWVRAHRWLPVSLLAKMWQLTLNTKLAQISMAEHAKAAVEEMQQVTADFQALIRTVKPG